MPLPETVRSDKKLGKSRPMSSRGLPSTSAQSVYEHSVLNAASNKAIHAINHLFATKLPDAKHTKISAQDQAEIKALLQQKQRELKAALGSHKSSTTPYSHLKQQEARKRNRLRDSRREKILEKQFVEELQRVKTSKKLAQFCYRALIKTKMQRAVTHLKKNKKLEREQKQREVGAHKRQAKQLIMDNIKNY